MAFKVRDFMSHFAKHKDFAKTSKFDVLIYKPPGLALQTTDLRFQCETSELPGYNINTVDGKYYGVPQSVASVSSFGDINLTFICAADLWEKKLFDLWMNLISPVNSYLLEYKTQYSTKIEINQYYESATSSSSPEKSYTVTLFNAFPVSISPLQLNWADDGIHRLSVTFKYDYWQTAAMGSASSTTDIFSQIDTAIRDKAGGVATKAGAQIPGGFVEGVTPRGIIPGGFVEGMTPRGKI